MKGSLNLQIDYDTTRLPSGDRRYDFVTKVNGDPILDQLSLNERQTFDMGIANHVNEMLAGTHRILVPKEKWLFEDVCIILYCLNKMFLNHVFQFEYWREMVSEIIKIDDAWKNIEQAVSESISDDFANLLKFPNPKIKYISDIYLRKILKAQFNIDSTFSRYKIDNVDDLIVFLREKIVITTKTLHHAYSVNIISELLKETYSFTEDELIFLLSCDDKLSLAKYIDEPSYVGEDQIRFIAKKADIDPEVFLSQVIATSKVLCSKRHETNR